MFLPKRTLEEKLVLGGLMVVGAICFALGLSSCSTGERNCDEPCGLDEIPYIQPNLNKCWCEPAHPREPREHFGRGDR